MYRDVYPFPVFNAALKIVRLYFSVTTPDVLFFRPEYAEKKKRCFPAFLLCIAL